MIINKRYHLQLPLYGALLAAIALLYCASPARSTTLAELIQGAKKEGVLHGQWGQNSFGGSEGFKEII